MLELKPCDRGTFQGVDVNQRNPLTKSPRFLSFVENWWRKVTVKRFCVWKAWLLNHFNILNCCYIGFLDLDLGMAWISYKTLAMCHLEPLQSPHWWCTAWGFIGSHPGPFWSYNLALRNHHPLVNRDIKLHHICRNKRACNKRSSWCHGRRCTSTALFEAKTRKELRSFKVRFHSANEAEVGTDIMSNLRFNVDL